MHTSVAGFVGTVQTIAELMYRILGPIPVDATNVQNPIYRWETSIAIGGTLVDEDSITTAWIVYQDTRGATYRDRVANATRELHNRHGFDLADAVRLVQLAARWTGNIKED